MPALEALVWDSEQLNIRVARVNDVSVPPAEALDAYDLVLAKIPQEDTQTMQRMQAAGFRLIGMELNLRCDAAQNIAPANTYNILRVRKEKPAFAIQGFYIRDSRLMLDAACKKRLPADFWDRLIYNHCAHYADTVLCAVENNKLIGFISCIDSHNALDLFMVGVHPDYQRKGVGCALIQAVGALAKERGLPMATCVFAHNTQAIAFYEKHGFRIADGYNVMHRWYEKRH